MCFSSTPKLKPSITLEYINQARLFERIFFALKNRSGFEDLIIEKITEIVNVLSRNNESFVKEYKREIIDIFESDEFFKCNVNTLKVFSRLIDRFLDVTKHDILSEHFETFIN